METHENYAAEAAEKRAQILKEDALGYTWNGELLKPYSARRELLFHVLAAEMANIPECAECNRLESLPLIEEFAAKRAAEMKVADGTYINFTKMLPEAAIVLWLVFPKSIEFEEFQKDRLRWAKWILKWADETIPPAEIPDAVRLAYKLRTQHMHFLAIPKPEAGASNKPGN